MARLQHTIDNNLKKQAESILETQGLTPAVAARMFYIEIVNQKGLPFVPSKVNFRHIPNKLTAETIEKAEKGIDIVECDSVEDMFNKLEE